MEISRLRFNAGDIALVRAYAGTGKSTCLRLLAEANPSMRIRYLVFNKAMAVKASSDFPKNVDCRTSHSLAFASHGKQFQGRLGTIRAKDIARQLRLDVETSVMVIETLENWFHSSDPLLDESHVNGEDFIKTKIASDANMAWRAILDESKALPMPHDGYQKLWSLSAPYCAGFDLLMIDESQDLNPVLMDYASRSSRDHGVPVIFVGDQHQSIYSWRGAIDAIAAIDEVAKHRLSLTQSFRFGQKIANLASSVLNHLKNDPVQIIGARKANSAAEKIQLCILGRTNFALIERALKQLDEDSESRFHFAATTKQRQWNPRDPYRFQDLLDVLSIFYGKLGEVKTSYFRKFKSWNELIDYSNAGDMELKYLTRIVSEYRSKLPIVLSRLEQASTSPDLADIYSSTAHRSRGLEWDVVELLSDFANPFELEQTILNLAIPPEVRRSALEEANLIYVGITRAKMLVTLPEEIRLWLGGKKALA